MGSCIKVFSYISAAIHLVLTLLGTIASIVICVWYKSDSRQDFIKEYGISDTPFWLYVVYAIFFGFGFLSTISLIIGIRKERFKSFHSFFSNMSGIIIFITIRAFIVMARHIKADYSAGAVASEFLTDIGFCAFLVIVMIPLFILYKELAGESCFQYCLGHCMCSNKRHTPTRVPNTEV